MNLAYLGFLCITLLVNGFSADPLTLKNPVPLEKKQSLGYVIVFERTTKQRQLNA